MRRAVSGCDDLRRREFVTVTLGLGANLGDPLAQLEHARREIESRGLMKIELESDVFHTVALGPPQPDYCNQVISGQTDLAPLSLLAGLQSVETDLGRPSPERRLASERWGPRLIDLDILDYGGEEIDVPGLRVPHEGIAHREFVLRPWSQIAPGFRVAGWNATIAELLERWTAAGAASRDGRREGAVR